ARRDRARSGRLDSGARGAMVRAGGEVARMKELHRHSVDASAWQARTEALARGERDLLALFGDDGAVQMLTRDPQTNALDLASIEVEGGRYPSVAAHHAPALRLERTI